MRTLQVIAFFIATASTLLGAEQPPAAVVAKMQERGFELTRSVRTNGCRLEHRRYTKSNPQFQGYWADAVFVGDKHILTIEHSATFKEQSLVIEENTGYRVLQIDRDLDGKYEMFILVSLKDQSLKDVLLVTDDGWLRHSTSEEFAARLKIAEGNRRAIEHMDKALNEESKKANEELKKLVQPDH